MGETIAEALSGMAVPAERDVAGEMQRGQHASHALTLSSVEGSNAGAYEILVSGHLASTL